MSSDLRKLRAMPFQGSRLKEAREKKGLKQKELAALTGINEMHLSRLENDKSEPLAGYLEILATHLDVTADYLLGLTDQPNKPYGDAHLSDEERAMVEILRRKGWNGVLRLVADHIGE
jgi:transcriptional regulator with XRE-family HTH domain